MANKRNKKRSKKGSKKGSQKITDNFKPVTQGSPEHLVGETFQKCAKWFDYPEHDHVGEIDPDLLLTCRITKWDPDYKKWNDGRVGALEFVVVHPRLKEDKGVFYHISREEFLECRVEEQRVCPSPSSLPCAPSGLIFVYFTFLNFELQDKKSRSAEAAAQELEKRLAADDPVALIDTQDVIDLEKFEDDEESIRADRLASLRTNETRLSHLRQEREPCHESDLDVLVGFRERRPRSRIPEMCQQSLVQACMQALR